MYNPPKHRRIKVQEAKLGREKALGMVDVPPYKKTVNIKVEERRNQKVKLGVIIHEGLHLLDPTWSEAKILKYERYLAHLVWKFGYRK